MSESADRGLVFRNEYGEFLKLCLDLTVYWSGSVFDRVDGVLDFYNQVLSLMQNHFKYYLTESMEGGKRIKPDTLDLLPYWLTKADRRDMYVLSLESGENEDTLSDTGFYFCADEEEETRSGALRLMLPIMHVTQPKKYVEQVISLVRELDFDSGHAGYSVNWFPTADSAEDALSKFPMIARRYPGIDLMDLDITLYAIGTAEKPGIKCVNWLTLLGSELARMAGGADAIMEELPPECLAFPINKGGVLVQAGLQPETGDRNLNVSLNSYHAVGRVLAPLRMQHHPDFVGATAASPGEDLTHEWLSRFD